MPAIPKEGDKNVYAHKYSTNDTSRTLEATRLIAYFKSKGYECLPRPDPYGDPNWYIKTILIVFPPTKAPEAIQKDFEKFFRDASFEDQKSIKKELSSNNIPFRTNTDIFNENEATRNQEIAALNLSKNKINDACFSIIKELTQAKNGLETRHNTVLSEKNSQRYEALDDLIQNVKSIKTEVQSESNLSPSELEKKYRNTLTNTVTASLANKNLDKYNTFEKIGITLLNIIHTILIIPPVVKYFGMQKDNPSAFYSTEGKPTEAVKKAKEIIQDSLKEEQPKKPRP